MYYQEKKNQSIIQHKVQPGYNSFQDNKLDTGKTQKIVQHDLQ